MANCNNCGELFVKNNCSNESCSNCRTNKFKNVYLPEINHNTQNTNLLNKRLLKEEQSAKLCKLCRKPINNNSKSQVCLDCLINLAKQKSSTDKINDLRKNIQTKNSKKTKYKTWNRNNKFKDTFKAHLAKYANAIEQEILPEINTIRKLKLSNNVRVPVMRLKAV